MFASLIKLFVPISAIALILVGCSSTESALTPINSVGSQNAASTEQNISSTNLVSTSSSVTETDLTGTKVHFLPIIGAPAAKTAVLSRRLAVDAQSGNIAIVSQSNAEVQYSLKGFLSAFSDETNTTVVYVWDILDPTGKRKYRLQGQKIKTGSATDPWQIVDTATMEAIAVETIKRFDEWQRSQT